MEHYRCERDADISELKTNMKALFKRTDEMRQIYESLQQLTINTSILVEQMKDTRSDVDKIKVDIESIKRLPADNYQYYIKVISGGAIGAVVGYLLKGLL